MSTPPGALGETAEQWGAAASLLRTLPPDSLVVADSRVLRLHPSLVRSIRVPLVRVKAGEATKSLRVVETMARAAQHLPRSGTLVALGGGTIGDVATVAAHLIKRGVRLIHVPTTLLAAVDSSLGGKGAVNVGEVKNALGVFHSPAECWLCPELFKTLSVAQVREGQLEAWKMALTLDAAVWRRWRKQAPAIPQLVSTARALKNAVCTVDPYETKDVRVVLNFGHTFGHLIESVTNFSVRHGEAVGLGMLCALDVGVRLGVTPRHLRDEVEASLPNGPNARARLARALKSATPARAENVLRADKKSKAGALRMVLVTQPGQWRVQAVEAHVWRECLASWKRTGRHE